MNNIETMIAKYAPTIIIALIAGIVGALLVINSPLGKQGTSTTTASVSTDDSVDYQPQSDQENRVVDAVQAAAPAVVSIVITADVPVVEQYFEQVPNNDPFGGIFGNPFNFQVPKLRQNGTEKKEIGGGTGFIVSSDGTIVTNRHVVDQTEVEYTVFLQDGTKYEAEVIARDTVNDIAVIKIDAGDLPSLKFGNSDALRVGQTTIAIGNALSEFRNTVSVGVISGLSRSITASSGRGQAEQLEEVIQTDAAINPGNSGGPLLNLAGEVIGVNVAVAQGSENIGFALPANAVKGVITSVQETGKIVRPYLGVRYIPVTPVLKETNNLSVDHGVIITRGDTINDLAVIPGSPAHKAGLQEGDIILEIDNQQLNENLGLASAIGKKRVGDSVNLKVLQKDSEKEITVTLEEAPG